jgi:hypothetical protein
MKKNKKKNRVKRQKKKQKKQLEKQVRFREYTKDKNAPNIVVDIHWDDLHFLDNWKSLEGEDLMEKAFQFDIIAWITEWVQPKKMKEYQVLHNDDEIFELLQKTFDDTLECWAKDTNGFTEKLPERYSFSQKNQTLFMSLLKNEAGLEWDEEAAKNIMEHDRQEWFSVVFAETIDEMINKMIPSIREFINEYDLTTL